MSAAITAPAPARVRRGHASHANGDASTAEVGCDDARTEAERDGAQSRAGYDRVHVGRGGLDALAGSVRQDPSSGRAKGPARRSDDSLIGQLNAEWLRLCAAPASDSAVARWRLAGVRSLGDLEAAVRRDADGVLLPLLRLGQGGDQLALRSVFQLMLGKAVRIAATHAGRDSRANLEQAAVTALWTVIAGYPVERRPVKVAANIAMDTLRLTVNELAHQRHETPSSHENLHSAEGDPAPSDRARVGGPADLELLDLLAWAVGNGTVSREDATLLVDIYAPGPGQAGGSAAAGRHGISWAAARQRASRATRRIAEAVRADGT
ncbi:hypothetical protein [Jiangella alba]|uniref:Uncharacterized protein n=1 Tax=Jiangella alba TaxID=561176 RepID=A0A1H5D7I9_9ACTN|nr:hypothetical protein [Jiangella alba]SED74728.1 hypothetical protein SAMN04488561_0318 [Jiangella alba]